MNGQSINACLASATSVFIASSFKDALSEWLQEVRETKKQKAMPADRNRKGEFVFIPIII